MTADPATAELQRLRDRLEVDPRTPVDGIEARDETIRQLEQKLASASGHEQMDDEAYFKLKQQLADMSAALKWATDRCYECLPHKLTEARAEIERLNGQVMGFEGGRNRWMMLCERNSQKLAEAKEALRKIEKSTRSNVASIAWQTSNDTLKRLAAQS